MDYFFEKSWCIKSKKLIYVCCIVITFCIQLNAQKYDLRLLEEKATNFLSTDYDSALYHFTILDSLAEIENDTFCRISAMSFFASHYYLAKDDAKSVVYCDKLVPIVKDASERVTVYMQCGSAYQNSNALKAEEYYLKAIETASENNMIGLKVPATLGNYASFLMMRGNFEKSIIYYQNALKYDVSDFSKVSILNNISNNYLKTSNTKRAKETIDESARIAEENNFKVRGEYVAWMLSRIATRENDFKTAHVEIDKAIENYQGKKNIQYVQALIHKAKIFIKQNDWKSAKEQYKLMQPFVGELENLKQIPVLMLESRIANHEGKFNTAISKSKNIIQILEKVEDESNRMSAYGILAKSYEGLGQKNIAYEYLVKKEKLANSLFRSNQARLVAQLEAEFERKEQDRKIDF